MLRAKTKKRLSPKWGQSVFFCLVYAFKNADEALRSVCLFKTSRANVTRRFFAVFHVGNLLNVCFESSSRLTVRVAYVVARRLTFTANTAYSRHIDTSD